MEQERSKSHGITIGIIGVLIIIMGPVVLFGLPLYLDLKDFNPLIWLAGVILMAIGIAVLDHAKRYFVKSGQQVLAQSPQKQTWYLRSFTDEQAYEDAERALAAILEEIAPLVAIGRPTEPLPPLGAARIYYPDDTWQDNIRGYLTNSAQIVVIRPGDSPGLGWELKCCRDVVDPKRLVILVPSKQTTYETFKILAKKEAELELPDWPVKEQKQFKFLKFIGLVAFMEDWSPRLVMFSRLPLHNDDDARLRLALRSITDRLGIKIRDQGVDRFKYTVIGSASVMMIGFFGFELYLGFFDATAALFGVMGLIYLAWVWRSRRRALARRLR